MSTAQQEARADYTAAKQGAHLGDTPHGTRAQHIARMRNAWVAYRAGAPWMVPPSTRLAHLEQFAVDRADAKLRAKLDEARAENEQLVAAVLDARLPSVTEAERESLRAELLIMRHERDEARAEVERLRGVLGEAIARVPDDSYGNGLVIAEARDALAREDGER